MPREEPKGKLRLATLPQESALSGAEVSEEFPSEQKESRAKRIPVLCCSPSYNTHPLKSRLSGDSLFDDLPREKSQVSRSVKERGGLQLPDSLSFRGLPKTKKMLRIKTETSGFERNQTLGPISISKENLCSPVTGSPVQTKKSVSKKLNLKNGVQSRMDSMNTNKISLFPNANDTPNHSMKLIPKNQSKPKITINPIRLATSSEIDQQKKMKFTFYNSLKHNSGAVESCEMSPNHSPPSHHCGSPTRKFNCNLKEAQTKKDECLSIEKRDTIHSRNYLTDQVKKSDSLNSGMTFVPFSRRLLNKVSTEKGDFIGSENKSNEEGNPEQGAASSTSGNPSKFSRNHNLMNRASIRAVQRKKSDLYLNQNSLQNLKMAPSFLRVGPEESGYDFYNGLMSGISRSNLTRRLTGKLQDSKLNTSNNCAEIDTQTDVIKLLMKMPGYKEYLENFQEENNREENLNLRQMTYQ